MLEMVEARGHADVVEQRHDLFNGLLDAVQDELNTGAAINEEELIGGYSMSHCLILFGNITSAIPGNMFIFLLAGHEVGFSCPLYRSDLKPFPTDYSTLSLLHICLVGSLSR